MREGIDKGMENVWTTLEQNRHWTQVGLRGDRDIVADKGTPIEIASLKFQRASQTRALIKAAMF